MQVQVVGFQPAPFTFQNVFQLCYSNILEGDDGNFTLFV